MKEAKKQELLQAALDHKKAIKLQKRAEKKGDKKGDKKVKPSTKKPHISPLPPPPPPYPRPPPPPPHFLLVRATHPFVAHVT